MKIFPKKSLGQNFLIDEDILNKISLQRAFGVDRTHAERKIPGQYDVNLLGYNYRMNELQAAIGTIQVGRLDGFLKKRKQNYEVLSERLSGISEIHQFESTNENFESSYYCKSIVLEGSLKSKRIEIIEGLKSMGVGTSIYYPRPIPELTYYREKYGYDNGLFPQVAKIAYQSIALPTGPHLDTSDAAYISDAIVKVINDLK